LEQCSKEQKELDAQKQLVTQQLAQLEQQKGNVAKEVEKLQQQYQMEYTVVGLIVKASCDPNGLCDLLYTGAAVERTAEPTRGS